MKTTATAYCAASDCSKPSPSSSLCRDHTGELWAVVSLLPDRVVDLDISRTRRDRFSKGGGGQRGKTNETPLLFDARAGDTYKAATTVLTAWQGRLADHFGVPVRYATPAAAAYWILGTVAYDTTRLPTFVDAGRMLDELTKLLDRIDKVIDRPKHLDAWFAGRCSIQIAPDYECPQMLYGEPDASVITCPRCNYHHDVAYRRSVLLKHANDTLVTATEAARAITVLTDYNAGETRLVRRIGTWVDRSRLTQRGTLPVAGKPRPLYRLGDIIDLLDYADTKKPAGPKKRAAELDILTEGKTS